MGNVLCSLSEDALCPWLSATFEQKSQVFLREEDKGRSEVKNKKHLKKDGWNSMKLTRACVKLFLSSFIIAK